MKRRVQPRPMKRTVKAEEDPWEDEWITPAYIYTPLNDQYEFSLDPCATDYNRKCDLWFGEADNGLDRDWYEIMRRSCMLNFNVFVNPPYSKLHDWVPKCIEQAAKGCTILLLLPVRSDNDWWNPLFAMAQRKEDFHWYRDRIRFEQPPESPKRKTSPRFPSFNVVLGPPLALVYGAALRQQEERHGP